MSRTFRTHPKTHRRMRDGAGMAKTTRSREHSGIPYHDTGH